MVTLAAITALGLISLTGQTAAATVKIMPFGASIVGAPGCWRAQLWKKLQAAGITNTDFVGSNKAPDCGFPYDGENEGHAGSLATEVADKNQLVGYLSATTPDVILMHLGTNDVLQRKNVGDVIAAYSKLVDQMRASKSTMKIIISQLIPIKDAQSNNGITELNKAIVAWGPTKSTSRSPIVIVDNNTGFNTTTDTVDGEHPNTKGDLKLADKFFQPLVDAIKAVVATTDCAPGADGCTGGIIESRTALGVKGAQDALRKQRMKESGIIA